MMFYLVIADNRNSINNKLTLTSITNIKPKIDIEEGGKRENGYVIISLCCNIKLVGWILLVVSHYVIAFNFSNEE